MIPGIPRQYEEKILELFKALPKGTVVILFGSRAKGNYREGSDIDIALRNEKLTPQDRDDLLVRYDSLYLPWKLDLVIYHLIDSPALKEHVDRIGKLLKPL